MIPYARQSISQQDVDAVVDVLTSEFLTQGPTVPKFEAAIKSYVGVRNCVAVNSATSGLHIACLALGVGPGDVVWTSAISFVASANCARMCGAEIEFVDIDPDTFNISPDDLERRLEEASDKGVLPKVLIVVHMCGLPADLAEISRVCSRFSVLILEDASHAIGARYEDGMVGSCKYSAATVFSFHPVKVITTGEGGAVTTSSDELAKRMQLLRSHGVTRDPEDFDFQSEGYWYYEQQVLGFNYRMTDISAALGLSQISRVEEFVNRRNDLANGYGEALKSSGVVVPKVPSDRKSSFHLYVVQIDFDLNGIDKSEFFERMKRRGIMLNVHYRPIYEQPFYRTSGVDSSSFPHSNTYYKRAVSLPMYVDLSDSQRDLVATALIDEACLG